MLRSIWSTDNLLAGVLGETSGRTTKQLANLTQKREVRGLECSRDGWPGGSARYSRNKASRIEVQA